MWTTRTPLTRAFLTNSTVRSSIRGLRVVLGEFPVPESIRRDEVVLEVHQEDGGLLRLDALCHRRQRLSPRLRKQSNNRDGRRHDLKPITPSEFLHFSPPEWWSSSSGPSATTSASGRSEIVSQHRRPGTPSAEKAYHASRRAERENQEPSCASVTIAGVASDAIAPDLKYRIKWTRFRHTQVWAWREKDYFLTSEHFVWLQRLGHPFGRNAAERH